MNATAPDAAGCCGVTHGCVFAKALLARAGDCECAQRRHAGEATAVDCRSAEAHHDCQTLAALLTERARFALRLPSGGRPLLHVQALRLQCGGIAALRGHLRAPRNADPDAGWDATAADVHDLVARARPWDQLPWPELVRALAAWQPRRRGRIEP